MCPNTASCVEASVNTRDTCVQEGPGGCEGALQASSRPAHEHTHVAFRRPAPSPEAASQPSPSSVASHTSDAHLVQREARSGDHPLPALHQAATQGPQPQPPAAIRAPNTFLLRQGSESHGLQHLFPLTNVATPGALDSSQGGGRGCAEGGGGVRGDDEGWGQKHKALGRDRNSQSVGVRACGGGWTTCGPRNAVSSRDGGTGSRWEEEGDGSRSTMQASVPARKRRR